MLDRDRLFARTQPIDVTRSNRLLALLVLLVIAVVVWANIAIIDEQVRAQSEVIVSSRSQVVQAVDGGTLKVLHVREGQRVKQGDLLAELDQARFEASSAETRAKALSYRANVERLTAELSDQPLNFSQEVEQDTQLTSNQRALHQQRLRQQREQRNAIWASLKLAKEELALMERLAGTGDAPYNEILRLRRQVSELQAELANTANETRREAQAKLAEFQSQLNQTEQVLKQREEALQDTYIVAPMSGTVSNIDVTTIGAVLARGAELMQIVPSDDPLLIEARVQSGDVAFVRRGLPANIKLDAYDFTVYGSLKGTVSHISADTIDEDLEQNEQPYYRVLIEVDEIPQRFDSVDIELIPGMTGLVEIITGERTVAQYMLKPIRRGTAAALTER